MLEDKVNKGRRKRATRRHQRRRAIAKVERRARRWGSAFGPWLQKDAHETALRLHSVHGCWHQGMCCTNPRTWGEITLQEQMSEEAWRKEYMNEPLD